MKFETLSAALHSTQTLEIEQIIRVVTDAKSFQLIRAQPAIVEMNSCGGTEHTLYAMCFAFPIVAQLRIWSECTRRTQSVILLSLRKYLQADNENIDGYVLKI